MFSIIICSISPERLEETKKNITETIGDVPHEFIVQDNRKDNLPIAAAYNRCAAGAQYEYLFFVHEDMRFYSRDWGKEIARKLSEPDCGAIGFAGSTYKPAIYSGWWAGKDYEISHYRYINDRGEEICWTSNITEKDRFKEVVTLDGMGLFVRKEVYEKHPFDEKALPGFHCYDMDFTLGLTDGYRNWCCYLEVLHTSNGSFDDRWIDSTIAIHKGKWSSILPKKVSSMPMSRKERRKADEQTMWAFFKNACKQDCPRTEEIYKDFCRMPFSFWHLSKRISGASKIRKYRKRITSSYA